MSDPSHLLPLSPTALLARLDSILSSASPIGFDTEGQEWCTCLCFATSPSDVLVIDTLGLRGHPDGPAIWNLVRSILESSSIPKWCWAAGHERGFLQWAHGITLRNYHDAMIAWRERWCELPAGLKYAASHLTRLPCWTEGISWSDDDDRPSTTGPALWRYNGYDGLATYALAFHPQLQLTGRQLSRYHLNLSLIEPLNWMSQRGVRFDYETNTKLREEIEPALWEAQATVDALAGYNLPGPEALLEMAVKRCCLVRKLRLIQTSSSPWIEAAKWTKKDCAEPLQRAGELARLDLDNPATRGELGALLGCGLNVKSAKQVTSTLNRLGLPPVFKRGGRRKEPNDSPSQTKDAEALLSLFLRTGHPITTALLETISLRGRLQELSRRVDKDGRIRCAYTGCGTETFRVTSHKWLTGSGGNLQTVPKSPVNFRRQYVADPDHLFWAVDLTGADLWTVAARCAELGDQTMLLDLRAGIRIPSLVGLMMEGYQPQRYSRAEVLAQVRAYPRDWRDHVWKIVGHMSNYGGKVLTIRKNVIEKSYEALGKPIDPGLELCQRAQSLYLGRYWGLELWWRRTGDIVTRTGCLELATGQVREFLSRRVASGKLDDATRREALAAEPQGVTTWVTNQALLSLWNDPENWREREPVVQPLLHTHDELAGQVRIEDQPFARAKLPQWFTHALRIGKELVTIPFAGAFGPSWGECKEGL